VWKYRRMEVLKYISIEVWMCGSTEVKVFNLREKVPSVNPGMIFERKYLATSTP